MLPLFDECKRDDGAIPVLRRSWTSNQRESDLPLPRVLRGYQPDVALASHSNSNVPPSTNLRSDRATDSLAHVLWQVPPILFIYY